jgi:hypothetical protein
MFVIGGLAIALGWVVLDSTQSVEETPEPAPQPEQAQVRKALPTRTVAARTLDTRTLDEQPAAPPTVSNIPAQEPATRKDLRGIRVKLSCEVDITGPPVKGHVWLVSWPGSGRDDPSKYTVTHRTVRYAMQIADGVMTFKTSIAGIQTDGEHLRHTADLMVPGYAATRFEFLTPPDDGPSICVQSPIQLQPATHAVVGTVRLTDGSPAADAIVEGCDARTRTDSEGTYFLVPRALPCALLARHAPGTATQSDPQTVEAYGAEDLVMDFTVEVPETPNPGVTLRRNEDGIATIWSLPSGVKQWNRLTIGTHLLRVGDVPTNELSDEEVLMAMVSLDEPLRIYQEFQTYEGEVLTTESDIEAL